MSPNDPPKSSSSKEIIPAELDIDLPIDDETELSVDGSPTKKKQKISNSPEPQPSKISENQKMETLGTGASTSTAAQGEPSGSLAIGAAVQVAEHGEQATNVVVADQLQEQAVDVVAELESRLLAAVQGFSTVDNVQEARQIPNMPFVLLPPILKPLIGTGKAVFVTKKYLTPSDVNPQRHQLLIHTVLVDLSFFSQQDFTNLNREAGSIKITLVVAGAAYDVTMRIRQMGASRYLALMQGWATVLENSNFEAGQEIAIYAFKDHNNVNVFYILPIHPPPA